MVKYSLFSVLNRFLFKIKRSPSPLCFCMSVEEEDVSHLLFNCAIYASHREAIKLCATGLDLSWPVPLHSFPKHKILWSALIKFLVATNASNRVSLWFLTTTLLPKAPWFLRAGCHPLAVAAALIGSWPWRTYEVFVGLALKKSASWGLGPSNGLAPVGWSSPWNVAKRPESHTWGFLVCSILPTVPRPRS